MTSIPRTALVATMAATLVALALVAALVPGSPPASVVADAARAAAEPPGGPADATTAADVGAVGGPDTAGPTTTAPDPHPSTSAVGGASAESTGASTAIPATTTPAPNTAPTTAPLPVVADGAAAVALSLSPLAAGLPPVDILPSLAGDWPTWSGDPSGITYDGDVNGLVIPASSPGQDLVFGVRRFELALTEGTTYSLAMQSADPAAAVIIFLFDATGALVPVPGSPGLAAARDGEPLTFAAPAGVTGFYLQVQNSWQAVDQATVSPILVDTGPLSVVNLFEPSDPWTDWAGVPQAEVAFDPDTGLVVLEAPAEGDNVRLGVQYRSLSLTAGTTYELAVVGPSLQSSVLLFLFDQDYQLVPVGPASWLTATTGTPVRQNGCGDCFRDATRFVAPAGVTSVAVQIQGPWGVPQTTSLLPSLVAVGPAPV